MALKIDTVQCPACGANLPYTKDKRDLYCSYCGTHIVVTNEAELLGRAALQKAETERLLELKELELQEKEMHRKRVLFVAVLLVALAFALVGILFMLFDGTSEAGGVSLLLSMAIGGWAVLLYNEFGSKRKPTRAQRAHQIQLTGSAACYTDEDYHIVESVYRGLGFTNVSTVNLHDIRLSLKPKAGIVEEVHINGEEPEEDEWYERDAQVIIFYHGFA